MAQAVATEKVLVADIAIDARLGGRDAIYTYTLERTASPGDAFLVPLGPRSAVGYALRIYEADEQKLGFPLSRLRPAGPPIEGLGLPDLLMRLVEYVASEYLCTFPVALAAAVPPGVLDRLETTWILDDERLGQSPHELNPAQSEVIKAIRDAGGKLRQSKGQRLQPGTLAALKSLRAKGILRQELSLAFAKEGRGAPDLLRLTLDDERVDTFLRKQSKKKPAQALTLVRLREIEHPALTAADIKSLCGVTDATLRALVEAKLLEKVDPAQAAAAQPPIPNAHQQIALDAITEALIARKPSGFLLFGVTGSGKTEVYLRAVAEALRQGRQALYLVPEIALATQAVSLLRERFGKRVAVLHSDLPPGERLENWTAVRRGEAAVVIGARSALFAPLTDIGLIILDEEHESSFKQESAPRYHAKRLARFLSEIHQCPVVFGSATPSVESFQEAENERITLLSLPERAAQAKLPSVHIENLAEGFQMGHPTLFSETLTKALAETLDKKQQAILFLNRRSYAPFLICRDCGHTFKCPRCAVSLAYSRKIGKLRCHHCDHQERPPESCPSCGGNRIRPLGVGTEKVEEAVHQEFPQATVARLDRDVAKRKGELERVLASFASGETNVLVGTQMVAKGLNFPNVTLVGVIAADISLNIPDFRSAERTYQLLSQVAGRAGRGSAPGQVVIQTFNPDHVAVLCAQRHDYVSFFEDTRSERKEAGYPPFRRLVNIVLSGENREKVVSTAKQVYETLRSDVPDAEILGPVDCAIERLHGRWRRHLLLKLQPDSDASAIGKALEKIELDDGSIAIDVDPYSLM